MEIVPAVIYGASGYSGRLIARELVRQGIDFVVAGRDGERLAALVRWLGRPIDSVVAPLDSPEALDRMAQRGRVVLSCAGPFSRWGRPVQDAALRNGRHYLDITGETSFMSATAARDGEARARDVVLVNAVGFDVVPTDAAAVVAAELAQAPIERVWIAVAGLDRVSRGTVRTLVTHARHGGAAFVDGELRHELLGAHTWEVPSGSPFGSRHCISLPWGDLATAPRSTGAREVRTFVAATPKRAWGLRLFSRAMAHPRLREPLGRLIERVLPALPEGPSEATRHQGHFAVYAEATGAAGKRAVWVTGGDAYDFTAAAAVWAIRRVASPEFMAKGALTPSQAFGARALLDGLARTDVLRWGEVK